MRELRKHIKEFSSKINGKYFVEKSFTKDDIKFIINIINNEKDEDILWLPFLKTIKFKNDKFWIRPDLNFIEDEINSIEKRIEKYLCFYGRNFYFIKDENEYHGYYSVSLEGELTIFIKEKSRKKGYFKETIKHIINSEGKKLFALVNGENENCFKVMKKNYKKLESYFKFELND